MIEDVQQLVELERYDNHNIFQGVTKELEQLPARAKEMSC